MKIKKMTLGKPNFVPPATITPAVECAPAISYTMIIDLLLLGWLVSLPFGCSLCGDTDGSVVLCDTMAFDCFSDSAGYTSISTHYVSVSYDCVLYWYYSTVDW